MALLLGGLGLAFVGLGLSLYFASQGSGRVLPVVMFGTVRLLVAALGGLWLAASGAPVRDPVRRG